MNMATLEQLSKHPDLQWMLTQTEVARRLGCSRQHAAVFLDEHSVPHHRVGNKKMYAIWDVMEALEKTKWK